MAKVLMKGNEALGEAAIRAGCRYFFGYPITPQNELPEYLSRRLPEVGGVFLQAESEIAAINMVYGAAGCGARVLTSSSGPGISLKQEGISYIAGAQLPCLIVNVMRGGPGLGSIHPSQADYFQATKGGGHGDYRLIVLAPSTIQEMVELVFTAFMLADKYRNPAMILADGILGQMMEPVEFPPPIEPSNLPPKEWTAKIGEERRKPGRERAIINSLFIQPEELEKQNITLQAKYKEIEKTERLIEEYLMEDAEFAFSGFGTAARVAKTAVRELRKEGYRVGLLRPITLWPFPAPEINKYKNKLKFILDVELNAGQMIEDVKLAIECKVPVYFYGRFGGIVTSPKELIEEFKKLVG